MSWQAYVDNNMVKTGLVEKGAIFGLDGSKWAISPGLNITADEVKTIAKGIDKAGPDDFVSGLKLAGVKYMFLRHEQGSFVYGRKGQAGVAIYKSKRAVLIGFYNENQQAGACNGVIEKLAAYLASTGY